VRTAMDDTPGFVWTQALEEKLLTLWRSRRCLFDQISVCTRAERQIVVSQVAAELGVTGK